MFQSLRVVLERAAYVYSLKCFIKFVMSLQEIFWHGVWIVEVTNGLSRIVLTCRNNSPGTFF